MTAFITRSAPVALVSALVAIFVAPLLTTPTAAQPAPSATIPSFWDPRAPRDAVAVPASRTVGFLTSGDFPPLHFLGADGTPTGFLVEVARAACLEVGVACTIQARPFGSLMESLDVGEGDALAAAIRITGDLRAAHAVTVPFYRFPARLAVRAEDAAGFDLAAMAEMRVGVVAGTAHEAYVATFWPGATRVPAENLGAAQEALRAGETDVLFADGLSLALWLGGRASEECCAFVSGPFLDGRYFGEGVGFVFRSEDARLARAFDNALARIWDEGAFTELWLRFFPVSPF